MGIEHMDCVSSNMHESWRLERERCEAILRDHIIYKTRKPMRRQDIAIMLNKNDNQVTQWLVWAVKDGVLNQYKRGKKVIYTAPAPWLHSPLWRTDPSFQGDVKIVMGETIWT